MKTNNTIMTTLFAILFLTLAACGAATDTSSSDSGGSVTGGTETGSTDAKAVDTSTVATRIDNATSALVLNVDTSSTEAPSNAQYTVDGTADEWSTYTTLNDGNNLTEIFGPSDNGTGVVTRIRVLVYQFSQRIGDIFTQDPDVDCTGATALTDSSTLTVAFYGELDNGAATNRNYDCFADETGDMGEQLTAYGRDSSGAIHVAVMTETNTANTEETATRGDTVKISSSAIATYGEADESDTTAGYLDLQFAHATVYNGPDGIFDTDDDMLFKSRSRATGRVTLDDAGEALTGAGEFSVTKFDQSATPENTIHITLTQALGRGDFGTGGYALFKINSTEGGIEDLARTFCIQTPSDGTSIPTAASDATSCDVYETAHAWDDATFPFTLTPAWETAFDDNAYYAGDDTDLISNSGDNFVMPTY